MIKLRCIYCNDCKQTGRQESNRDTDGRKRYYCTNVSIKDMKDKHGFPHSGFIGFGTNTWDSPLSIKTSPRWCPQKIK
jgi:hypothetical protein